MKNIVLILTIILQSNLYCIAQKNTLPSYFFTQKSERFFSDEAINDLLYQASMEVFEFNKVPQSVLDRNFKSIKPTLLAQAKPKIVKQFKHIEFYNETGVDAEEDSKSYTSVKNQYIKYFTREIEQAFLNNKELRKYLSFNTSDRITFFQSKVVVQPNGKLLVTETISIYNGDGVKGPNEDTAITHAGGNNNDIQRGIVRTFPVLYKGKYHLFYKTGFKILSVKRDGKKEAWQLKNNDNGYNLYIGEASYYLPEGTYTYTIAYETEHQLKQLKDFDELAWNATGNGWNFTIDSAEITIQLPTEATILSNACYTGAKDDKASDCNYIFNKDSNSITFKSIKPFKPKEGLTVATSWEKGIISSQSNWAYFWWMFKNNQAVFLLPLLAILFAIYNFIMWWRVGRDPKPGNLMPEFYPPKKLSPAAMGFIYNQGFDNKLVAATITDWAAQKYIRIDVEREGLILKHNAYKITAGTADEKVPAYENFGDRADDIIGTTISKGFYNSGLGSIRTAIERNLDTNYKATKENAFKGLFILNNWYMAPGNFLTIVGFFYVLFGVLTKPGMQNPWHFGYLFAGLILCIIVQSIYYPLIKSYTGEGRKLMDSIEGFRMFLKTADEQRFNAMNPPKKTIELYEEYLPFAIALNCEIEWSEHFKDIIATSSLNPSDGLTTMHSSLRYNSLTSSFSDSFSGAISSASSPPSSSSGGGSSFGGGSSGSGGGGGGGGGW